MSTDQERETEAILGAEKPPEVSWHDHLVMLLHVAAELEHGLMVQYLYAAYSLDSEGLPGALQAMVERWRRSILTVAKEEMGHFITVQNVLLLLGAPMNLRRRDFPWDAAYTPFPFSLRPLSRESLAAYLFAEMPSDDELANEALQRRYRQFVEQERDEIVALVNPHGTAHPIDVVYRQIIDLVGDEKRIPDSVFHEDSYALQANWDDWGRRCRPPPRRLTAEGDLVDPLLVDPASARTTNVIVMPVATRTQAVEALKAVSEQGEAPHLGGGELREPSHFDRFLEVYQEMSKRLDRPPAGDIATDPTTRPPRGDGRGGERYISAPRTRDWATLSNLRYRMLLCYLAHSMRAATGGVTGEPSLGSMLMHKVFAEMYNVKATAERLMRMPRGEPGAEGPAFAGPPFETPYDLALPHSERDAWQLHRELAMGSIDLCVRLLSREQGSGAAYLKSLVDLDRQVVAWTDRVLAGLGLTGRH